MNAKQTIPLVATLAPALVAALPLLVMVGAVGLVIYGLSSDDDTEKKPEKTPADAEAERCRKEAETASKTPIFRPIPAEIPVKPASAPAVAIIPPHSVEIYSPAPVPAAVTAPKIVTQAPPPPPTKMKVITPADVASVFHHGARALTRQAAVAALKSLGFGKTAAYDALSRSGRFADLLHFAPDGTITWTD
jgi:hypothetical protein